MITRSGTKEKKTTNQKQSCSDKKLQIEKGELFLDWIAQSWLETMKMLPDDKKELLVGKFYDLVKNTFSINYLQHEEKKKVIGAEKEEHCTIDILSKKDKQKIKTTLKDLVEDMYRVCLGSKAKFRKAIEVTDGYCTLVKEIRVG